MNDMSKIGGHAISVHKYKTLLEDKLILKGIKKHIQFIQFRLQKYYKFLDYATLL